MWNKIGNFLFPWLYWKGRLDGWRACEDMILERAAKFDKYKNIWSELIQ